MYLDKIILTVEVQVLLNQINDILLVGKNGSKTGTGLLIIKLETNDAKIKTPSNKRRIKV